MGDREGHGRQNQDEAYGGATLAGDDIGIRDAD